MRSRFAVVGVVLASVITSALVFSKLTATSVSLALRRIEGSHHANTLSDSTMSTSGPVDLVSADGVRIWPDLVVSVLGLPRGLDESNFRAGARGRLARLPEASFSIHLTVDRWDLKRTGFLPFRASLVLDAEFSLDVDVRVGSGSSSVHFTRTIAADGAYTGYFGADDVETEFVGRALDGRTLLDVALDDLERVASEACAAIEALPPPAERPSEPRAAPHTMGGP